MNHMKYECSDGYSVAAKSGAHTKKQLYYWPRKNVEDLAKRMGVMLTWNDTHHGELIAEAPPNTVFMCDSVHCLVCEKEIGRAHV